ncbi:thiamine phosphate synthase [Niveispirillum sp.]|uniref:thiamine phosphate synthase n=1 Tax=Niveispirillum sp. TaxID=1917217 RepID=UPI001B74E759|nr:thiamine phosphate synthase [Niveispirillum sp.]MBP7337142.1 thiamine phosphate synthase [Niveispirillum sp.]
MKPLPTPPLLLITDRTQAAGGLLAAVTACVSAGCRWVSLREKDLPIPEQAALLRSLRPLLAGVGGTLTVHGDSALASLCDGVHLPDGADIVALRAALGPDVLIGASCHDRAGVMAAAGAGADYATLSPIFPTASKPGYGPALGPSVLSGLSLPTLALGGVDADNLAACIAAGAAGVAVMGGPMRDPSCVQSLLAATPGRKAGI